MRHRAWLITAILVVTGCASNPLDTSGVDNPATPAQAVGAMPGQQGTRVQWGGEIVEVTNHDDATLIEVLSYPLGRDGLPNIYRKPTGRFVLRRAGFLEPQDYAPGRLLTAVGTIRALTRTTVGQTQLVIPLLSAEQLKLWRDRYQDSPRSRFGFGVGISIGL
ncbi:MAG TPA: Slp family lipoprotein [Arenicellales bacterium]|nr:Slp family lipoprotein [Arenicellales bacterium]